MSFLNRPRKAITCYCFINLKQHKIIILNHKCGISYFNHLFTKKFLGEAIYIDWKNTYQLGDWHLAVTREEIQNFSDQHDEREFHKMMITRNPYDRSLSFFTNTFWDNDGRKKMYTHTWKEMAGDRHPELLRLKEEGEFKETFEMFLDIQWNHPTDGVRHIQTMNNGLGDEHLYPQSLACKDILTDVEFIDIQDCQIAVEFLGFRVELKPGKKNPSSNSARVLDDGFFDDLDLTVFNEFYRDDFGLGYKICSTSGSDRRSSSASTTACEN